MVLLVFIEFVLLWKTLVTDLDLGNGKTISIKGKKT